MTRSTFQRGKAPFYINKKILITPLETFIDNDASSKVEEILSTKAIDIYQFVQTLTTFSRRQ